MRANRSRAPRAEDTNVRKLRWRSNSDGFRFSLSLKRDSNGSLVRMLSGKVEKRKSAVRNPAENQWKLWAVKKTYKYKPKLEWYECYECYISYISSGNPNSSEVNIQISMPKTVQHNVLQSESNQNPTWALPAKRVSLCITLADQLKPTCLQPVWGWVTGESECNFRSLVYIINLAYFPLQFFFFLFLYPGKWDFLILFRKLTIQKIPIQ